MHTQIVCEDLEIKNLGEHHDLYVQSDALLLADIFNDFQNMCIEIYRLNPPSFLSAPGLAWQEALKKTKVKLDLLNDIYSRKKLLKAKYVMLFIDMQMLITNIWKIMIKIKNHRLSTGM